MVVKKMSSTADKNKLKRAGVKAFNQPRRLINNPKGKSHIVVAKQNGKTKIIKFGDQKLGHAMKRHDAKSNQRRKNFKNRFKKLIAENRNNKLSAMFWSNKTLW